MTQLETTYYAALSGQLPSSFLIGPRQNLTNKIVKTSKIETNPRKFDTNLLHEEDYTNNFSPISSDEETEAIDLSSKCLEKEPSISPSPSPEKSKGDTKADEKENEDASKSEKEPKRKSFDMLEDLAAKIKAHNEKIQKTSTDESQSIKPLTDEKPMVKLEFPLTEIKSEPTDFITYIHGPFTEEFFK